MRPHGAATAAAQEQPPPRGVKTVSRVSEEQLVAAVAGQRDRHVLARRFCETRYVGTADESANGSSNMSAADRRRRASARSSHVCS